MGMRFIRMYLNIDVGSVRAARYIMERGGMSGLKTSSYKYSNRISILARGMHGHGIAIMSALEDI